MCFQKGCMINRKDKEGNTALSLSVRYHHDSCALTLMQKGADINGDIITDPDADKPPKPSEDQVGSQAYLSVPLPGQDISKTAIFLVICGKPL